MKIKIVNSNSKFVIRLAMVVILFTIYNLPFTNFSSAQTVPEFMITWKANSYVPPNYQGKILPTTETQVDMAMELIDNGALANISGNTIRWFVNGKLQKSGVGTKTFSFTTPNSRTTQNVDVAIVRYRGADITKRVQIPVVAPEVTIGGGPNIFKTLLYFFNIRNLSQTNITWTANGTQTEGVVENPEIINLNTANLPFGTEINLSVTAQNAFKPLETATKSIQIIK